MQWNFENDRPIYIQLEEKIKLLIITGVYPPGSKLPPVRDLAEEASVNPNTLQKALTDLEKEGLVFSQRTSGRFVSEDEKMIKEVKKDLALEQIEIFLKKMADMGYDKKETLDLIASKIKEMN